MMLTTEGHTSKSVATMTITMTNDGSEFRDIRADLLSRIKMLEATMVRSQRDFTAEQEKRAAEHKQVMESYRSAIAGYRRMLDLEESFAEHDVHRLVNKHGSDKEEVKVPLPDAPPALADFLVQELRRRGASTKEELREAAYRAGYFKSGDSGGRAVHATLVNIKKNGRVILEGEKYIAAPAEQEFPWTK